MVGETISHYRILKKIGQGGMGEVFLAYDTSLDRNVAAKFLPEDAMRDTTARLRFLREARSAAALDHPYICSIHEVGEAQGKNFIIMEYVDGQTLKERLTPGAVPLKEALEWTLEIAEALAVAHAKGIIHRDLKPSNIMLPRAGHVKVMDFGLAKQVFGAEQFGDRDTTLTGLTKEGTTVGTLPYMSPEQVHGTTVDQRSDLFSFGIVIYEMMAGINPFKRDSGLDTANAISKEMPAPISSLRQEVPQAVSSIIAKLLAKKPDDRYQTAQNAAEDLRHAYEEAFRQQVVITRTVFGKLGNYLRKPMIAIPLLLAVAIGGFFLVRTVRMHQKANWAREVLPKELDRLRGTGKPADMIAAFDMLDDARKSLPADAALDQFWKQFSRDFKADIKPEGASVYIKAWDKPDAPWQLLGVSPFTVRTAVAYWRCKIEKPGYETAYALKAPDVLTLSRVLDKEGSIPSGMARVAGVPASKAFASWPKFPDYYLDRYEVTNRQFREFARAGGYQKKAYWKYDFDREGKKISWEEAMSSMVDSTGRPGPSTWQDGDLPENQEDLPVSGVSWYEAAAYAEFAGKRLPTTSHWVRPNLSAAANFTNISTLVQTFSNFGSAGPVRIGTQQGMNYFGIFDMAGNVREWCWNEAPKGRCIRGGAWSDVPYMYGNISQADPFDRSPKNGFRCAYYPDPEKIPAEYFEAVKIDDSAEYARKRLSEHVVVSDDVFRTFKSQFAYDKGPLNAKVDKIEDSEQWTGEKVSFDAAYDNERMMGRLFLPKTSKPPFQVVIYFPGSDAVYTPSSEKITGTSFSSILKSGRAVFYPIYKGTHERNDGLTIEMHNASGSVKYREYLIKWVKDFSRSIDYLESRSDIDSARVAFYGFSWGGIMAPIIPAVESRIRVCIARLGGLKEREKPLPEADALNYVSRVKIPVLMLNGKYDLSVPWDLCGKPMFERLGTPEKDKILKLYNTDHFIPAKEITKEVLAFLDHYLGPVQRKQP